MVWISVFGLNGFNKAWKIQWFFFFFFSPDHLNLDPQCNPRLKMILVVEVKGSIFKKVLTIVTRSNINKLNFLQNSTNFKRNYTLYGVHLGSIETCFSKNQKKTKLNRNEYANCFVFRLCYVLFILHGW